MSCVVWLITRHKPWKKQRAGITHSQGKLSVIKQRDIRFENIETFTTFVRRANRVGAKPFFINSLPEKFFEAAIEMELSFGTIHRPFHNEGRRTYIIEWYQEGKPREIFRNTDRKQSNKGYYNRPAKKTK